MKQKKSINIFKKIATILVLIVMIGMIVYLFPVMKNLSSLEGQEAFKAKVESSGMMGMLDRKSVV